MYKRYDLEKALRIIKQHMNLHGGLRCADIGIDIDWNMTASTLWDEELGWCHFIFETELVNGIFGSSIGEPTLLLEFNNGELIKISCYKTLEEL